MNKIRVLFLCTGNSARSQMAEGFLREYGSETFEAYSAGLEPSVINPFTVKVMEESGIDISRQYSKPLSDYMIKVHFGYLVTVCSKAEEKCPIFPGMGQRLHWGFEDPAAFKGEDELKLEKFREVRDLIKEKVLSFIKENG